MKTHLVLEMAPGVDPVSAAKAFSEAPKVMNVMSIVDGDPMEIWRDGRHVASENSHPVVQAAQRVMDTVEESRNE